MAIGSAFSGGYGSGAQSLKNRSYLPMINTLGNIINQKNRGGGIRVADSPQNRNETRADRRERIAREDKLIQEERLRADEAQERLDRKEMENTTLLAAQEKRKQEAHEMEMAKQAQATEQQAQTFQRKEKSATRADAYENVKQSLMLRDAQGIHAGLSELIAQGEDVITEGEPVDGARSFKGRPGKQNIPQFIFDPDSEAVGVMFPGQDKPAVFKNAEEAFKNVLAPMNPAHEKSKDEITFAKNTREADYKDRKLKADIHKDAHTAAMEQFKRDGYYQPAVYNKEEYDAAYKDYISKATGKDPSQIDPPPEPTEEEKQGGQPEIYRGDAKPKGFPKARRGKDGAWYIKKGKGWAPILNGKGKKKKAAKGKMKSAGFTPPPPGNTGGVAGKWEQPTVIRKKIPPRRD